MTKGYSADLSACGLYHLVKKKGCGDTVCSRNTVISSLTHVFLLSLSVRNQKRHGNPPLCRKYELIKRFVYMKHCV